MRKLVVSLLTGLLFLRQGAGSSPHTVPAPDGSSLRQGPVTTFYPNGEKHWVGFFESGYLEGPLQIYSQEGRLIEDCFFLHGEKNGLDTRYRENGLVHSRIEYRGGTREGASRFYDESGRLVWESFYRQGLPTQSTCYGERGEPVKASNDRCLDFPSW